MKNKEKKPSLIKMTIEYIKHNIEESYKEEEEFKKLREERLKEMDERSVHRRRYRDDYK